MDHYHNVSRERPKEKRAMHDDDSLMQNLMTSKSMKSKFFVSSRRFRRPDLNFFLFKMCYATVLFSPKHSFLDEKIEKNWNLDVQRKYYFSFFICSNQVWHNFVLISCKNLRFEFRWTKMLYLFHEKLFFFEKIMFKNRLIMENCFFGLIKLYYCLRLLLVCVNKHCDFAQPFCKFLAFLNLFNKRAHLKDKKSKNSS